MPQKVLPLDAKLIWPGCQAPASKITGHLQQLIQRENRNWRLHYVWTYPGLDLDSEKLSIMRLCWYCSMTRPLKTMAVFDGVMQDRYFHNGDVIVGSYNAGNKAFEGSELSYGGFTISFHINYIRFNFCEWVGGKEQTNFYYHTSKPADGVLLHMVRTLDALIHEPDESKDDRAELLLEAICRQLFHELNAQPDEDDRSVPPLVARMKNFIDHNYQRAINCNIISDAMGINRSYASELFRQTYNITMAKYLLNLRIEAAKYLLKSQQRLKLEDIAHACAFSNPGYFIRVFRENVGITPNNYRNNYNHDRDVRDSFLRA